MDNVHTERNPGHSITLQKETKGEMCRFAGLSRALEITIQESKLLYFHRAYLMHS
jgi:hypothetical protein